MPLSDREQHLLEQMEQALSAEDPKFASHMRGVGGLAQRRRYIVAAVGFLVGLGVVLVGVNLSNMWVGAIGFVVMVAAVVQAVAPPRKRKNQVPLGPVRPDGSVGTTHSRTRSKGRAPKARPSGTFMQRLEQRWDRRRGSGGW
ncbi:conserved hypothetical protein [Nostocoides japonicum T1-X7]|uniref:Transmembrane protein n=1 Tax=Nostocoides japonicum T1-X7 TaxID=1194083 RepID=A0A077LYM7_9MICO|nr:DUF3040 domain-containing protein [Tetrasphaera japonica]CCH77079.1 conserved hypothetical protein [Tetrasphaera japonica T1-X7]